MRDRAADRRLMRYLHGELPADEVRRLRAELARDPALQARLAELHRLWQGLQPSPPTPAPFGYVPKLQRLAEKRRVETATSALGWGAAPPWARALAGAALLAGTALGVGLGRLPQATVPTATTAGLPAVVASASRATAAPALGAVASPPIAAATATAGASTAAPGPNVAAPRDSQPASGATAAPADVFTDEESEPLAGSTTLAEEYWQALEAGSMGDERGGAGEARW